MELFREDDAAVLEAALALIDDCYEAADHSHDSPRHSALAQPRNRRRFQLSEQITRLRESVDELRVVLDGCRRPSCADSAKWLWASAVVDEVAVVEELKTETVEEIVQEIKEVIKEVIKEEIKEVIKEVIKEEIKDVKEVTVEAVVAVNQLALRVEAVEENFRLRRAIRLQLGRALRSI